MNRLVLLGILSAYLVSACSAARDSLGRTILGPISECFPSRTVLVWQDSNGDGRVDDGELPLAGIAVTMYPLPRSHRSFPGQTGEDGRVILHGIGDFGARCDELEVAVDVPHQYLPTTPTTISLVGVPSDQLVYFGLVSQFPTPVASLVLLDHLTSGEPFFQACSLLEPQDSTGPLGALEFPLVSSGAIGEAGLSTYDCLTSPQEPAAFMYYSLLIGETAGAAAAFFEDQAAALPAGAARADGVGEAAWTWAGARDEGMHLLARQANVVLRLDLRLDLEGQAGDRQRLLDLGTLLLERLFARGG